MAKKKELTPEELEQQADALLAAADAAEEAAPKQAEATKSSKKASKRGVPAEEEPPHVMTDEEAKKAGIVRLDDKQVAALPAAACASFKRFVSQPMSTIDRKSVV